MGGVASGKARRENADLKKKLELAVEEHGDDIVAALIAEAKDGNVAAAKEIFDRLYGKAVQKVESKNSVDLNTPPLTNEELLKLGKVFDPSDFDERQDEP